MGKFNKLDFTGQSIYVGIDVHKKSWNVTIYVESIEHKTFSMPAVSVVLSKYLIKNFPGAKYYCAYEAGYSGFWIHDELQKRHMDCCVVNPADVPTKDKERRLKNDRIDSRKLAKSLRNGELVEYIHSRSRELRR